MDERKLTNQVSPDQLSFLTTSTSTSGSMQPNNYQIEESTEVIRAHVTNSIRGPNKLNPSQTLKK